MRLPDTVSAVKTLLVTLCGIGAFGACNNAYAAEGVPTQAEELGIVEWGRDLDAAFAASQKDGRPVLVLFDEVPGCSTVLGFGQSVLAKATMKAFIETNFHPVLIYNNKGGADQALLKAFSEPAWNNPIVRVFDGQRREIGRRFSGPYNMRTFQANLDAALAAGGRTPITAQRGQAHDADQDAVAYFGMYCFWTGEGKIGGIDGVTSTRAGFLDGEVVEVRYDPEQLSYAALLRAVVQQKAADRVFTQGAGEQRAAQGLFRDVREVKGKFRFSRKDDKYQLRGAGIDPSALDPTMATKANAAAYRGEDFRDYLR